MVLECSSANHNLKVTWDSEIQCYIQLGIKCFMKHSFTSQTWPRCQPQSPDSPQHGQPAGCVQRARTYFGCPPSPALGSASQPPAKPDTSHSGHHSPFHNEDQYLFRTPIFHTSPSHLISLNYHVFRLKNSIPKRSFPAMKSLLVFDHPCFSSLNLFNLPYPFAGGGIRILHKT